MEKHSSPMSTSISSSTDCEFENVEIQHFIHPDGASDENLFVRRIGDVRYDAKTFFISPKGRLSFNTFFNSFFEAYWSKFTEIKKINIDFLVKGRGDLIIFRETSSGVVEVKQVRFDSKILSSASIDLEVRPSEGWNSAGRIFFDIVAKTGVEFVDFSILTSQRSRPVSISIGICTFNRQKYVAQTLLAIEEVSRRCEISTIYIVNQYDPFSDEDLISLVNRNKKISVILQDNLGGCGGFTRSLLEAHSDAKSDYHLLMDDDAYILGQMIERLINVLKFRRDDIVVGGQMLDLIRPSRLVEAGADLLPDGTIEPFGRDTDITSPHAFRIFLRAKVCHFNAWWFCAVPLKAINDVGLPRNIFIRGDDLEYGWRLSRYGTMTVSFPGIAVFHEPFYAKNNEWQSYYDLRNRLLFKSFHGHSFEFDSSFHLFGLILVRLLVHDYARAEAFLLAVRHFLFFRTMLDVRASVLHQDIAQRISKYKPPHISFSILQRHPLEPRKTKRMFRHLVIFKSFIKILLLKQPRFLPRIILDQDARPSVVDGVPYVLTNGERKFSIYYSPSRKIFLKKLLESVVVCLAFAIISRRTSRAWHEIGRSSQNWAKFFI